MKFLAVWAVALLPACAYADSPSLNLVCQWNVGGQHFSNTLLIDEAGQTVNGSHATFSDDAIIAELPQDDGSISHWQVNRISGSFRESCNPCIAVANGKPVIAPQAAPVTGQCDKAAKKF